MKTAIITGASSGLGEEFVRQLRSFFPEIERVWLVARRRERLDALAAELGEEVSVCLLPLDLCSEGSLIALRSVLKAEEPEVQLLINCAGIGFVGYVADMPLETQTGMTDLNVTALTAVTNLVLPYMKAGGHILNVSSIASFCPNARMTVYSATKAYVTAFSQGLREEMRPRGIGVCAVCPGPMDTEFLSLAGITGHSQTFERLPHTQVQKVAAGAYKAVRAGKAIYTPGLFFKFYRLVAKLLPEKLVVKWART